MVRSRFGDVLLEAIDESLGSLGESCRVAVHSYLQREYKTRHENIGENIGAFACALEGIFGFGAVYLKTLMLGLFCQKMRLVGENAFEKTDFAQALLAVKKGLEC